MAAMANDPGSDFAAAVGLRADFKRDGGEAEAMVCNGCGFVDVAPSGLMAALHREEPFCPNCARAWGAPAPSQRHAA